MYWYICGGVVIRQKYPCLPFLCTIFSLLQPLDWHWNTRVLLDGGRSGQAFIRDDDSFSVFVPAGVPGSYLVEVVNPEYHYEPVRVDITSKRKVRARMVNNLQPNQVTQVKYMKQI